MADEDRNTCILLLDEAGSMAPLHAMLETLGLSVDRASDLAEARTAFFGAGGHDCLVIGPGVSPGLARKVSNALADIDPNMSFATFGPHLRDTARARTARLSSYHPGSRAGQGALLRFLQTR
ncbi:MAG: hypothetical protein CMJ88_10415 [Planctomycetes bacterium]|nr:hypothetical protein [Planctomycetota bacterium]